MKRDVNDMVPHFCEEVVLQDTSTGANGGVEKEVMGAVDLDYSFGIGIVDRKSVV